MAFNFDGKKVLVTGAGRGIGRGISLALAKAGCKVYALDHVQENLEKLAAENSNIVTIIQDLRDWDTTKSTLENLEVMDGLVNNAAVLKPPKPALETSKEVIEDTFSVNLFATINCIQVIGKKMIDAKKKGSIVNMSSIGGQLAGAFCFDYRLSKAGVDMVTKQFALELGPHGIRVNSVNPKIVETEMTALLTKTVASNITERMPIARFLKIGNVVGPVLYLLSDVAAMVTGTTHLVDGGTSCNITTKS